MRTLPRDDLHYGHLGDGRPSASLEPVDGTAGLPCRRVFKSLKDKIKPVLHNKNMPWQPGVEQWWMLHQDELIKFITIVHKVASDDFDDYVMWVHNHPKVPDGEKHASYLAAQAVLDYVAASGVSGPWGSFHLVTRVSKWLLLQPELVNKWKQACFSEEAG